MSFNLPVVMDLMADVMIEFREVSLKDLVLEDGKCPVDAGHFCCRFNKQKAGLTATGLHSTLPDLHAGFEEIILLKNYTCYQRKQSPNRKNSGTFF